MDDRRPLWGGGLWTDEDEAECEPVARAHETDSYIYLDYDRRQPSQPMVLQPATVH